MSVLTDKEVEQLAEGIAVDDFNHDFANRIEAAVIKKLAGVSVEPVGKIGLYDSVIGFHGIPAGTNLFTLDQLNTAIAAARVQENERLAKHFDAKPGCEMFGGAIADEIRALIGGAA